MDAGGGCRLWWRGDRPPHADTAEDRRQRGRAGPLPGGLEIARIEGERGEAGGLEEAPREKHSSEYARLPGDRENRKSSDLSELRQLLADCCRSDEETEIVRSKIKFFARAVNAPAIPFADKNSTGPLAL